jgi:hypothetical protein
VAVREQVSGKGTRCGAQAGMTGVGPERRAARRRRRARGAGVYGRDVHGRAAPERKRRPQQARARVEQNAGGSRQHA